MTSDHEQMTRCLPCALTVTGSACRWNSSRALLEWARNEGADPDSNVRTFGVIALRYGREVTLTKTARTQSDNLKELD